MAIEINITPEDIDAFVRDALVKSSVGKLIDSTIQAAFKPGSYNNPIEVAIKGFMQDMVRQLLNTHYKEKIEAELAKAIASQITDEWLTGQAAMFAHQLMRDVRG